MLPKGTSVRVVHFQKVPNSLIQFKMEHNYITQRAFRSATSWLPPLWECFPFKQTRYRRRWRRVCRGFKEAGAVNESVQAGKFFF